VKTSPSGPPADKPAASKDIRLGALVVIATLVAYLPSLSGEFIWNDSDYVTAPMLRSFGGLARIWTDVGVTQQYYPLLHSAFWFQHRLFGDSPLGYHIVTLLLHAGSAVLFAMVLRRLFSGDLRNRYPGVEWLAALLFALHPVHVESVAWITEQKNTLSLAFYLGAALVYLGYDETRRPGSYFMALALFVLSLLCKTVTSSLPAALLVVFWWRRGRIDWRRDVLPLVPWLAIGAAAGVFSSWVERTYGGAKGAEFDISFVARGLVAGRATVFYVCNLAWPSGLDFIYPRWKVDPSALWQWLFPLGVLAAAAALWAVRRRTRGPLAAFLFFVGSLFPVLGFVNLYGARYSWVWDHWQYLPDLGLIALASSGLCAAWRHMPAHPRLLGPGLVGALALLLAGLTWSHCGMFHDNRTLYLANIELNPGSWMAHNNLGSELAQAGKASEAIAEYREALRLYPDCAEAHNNLGLALSKIPGGLNEAIAHYEEAIRLKPDFVEAHNNLGCGLDEIPGRMDDAMAQFQEALHIRPSYAEAHYNLGNTLNSLGRPQEAIAQFEEALRLDPGHVGAHNNLGSTLSKMPGRLDDGIAQYQEALRLDPAVAEVHNNLGNAWARTPGRINDAIAQYEEALRLRPEYADAHFYLANALVQTGRIPEAIQHYGEALRIQPNLAEASNNLGMILCRTGHNQEGMAYIDAAIRIQPEFVPAHFARGAALMQAGRRDEAAAEFEKVLKLRPGDPSALRMLELIHSMP
jgi:tetratricopeptide (TPR) repeat protein